MSLSKSGPGPTHIVIPAYFSYLNYYSWNLNPELYGQILLIHRTSALQVVTEDLKNLPQHRTFIPIKNSTIRSLKENKMKFTLFTAILFSMGWMSIEVSDDGPAPFCCFTVSNTRTPVGNILDYIIQDVVTCPVRAVRFHTRKNKIICSDPDDSWTKKAMVMVDRRKKLTMESSY